VLIESSGSASKSLSESAGFSRRKKEAKKVMSGKKARTKNIWCGVRMSAKIKSPEKKEVMKTAVRRDA